MKVAIVTVGELPVPDVKGGGAENLIEHIIEKNEEHKKMDITVYSIYDDKAQEKGKNFHHTRFVFLNKNKNLFFKRLKRKMIKLISDYDIALENFSYSKVLKDIKKNQFDVVVIENTMVPYLKYAKAFGKKVLLHTHFNYIHNELPQMVLKNYNKALKISGGIITVSEFIKKQILTALDVSSEKVYVLKNCTNLKDFNINFSEDKRTNIRKKYGINNEVVLLFAGRISPEKGVVELVKAFKLLNKENVKLVIVGSAKTGETIVNDYTNQVYNEVEAVKDKVIFTGYVSHEDMPLIYNMADIAVLPSTGIDAAPLTIFEAMASGLPIITTCSGGIPEYVNDKCALLSEVDENIISNLKENMEILIRNQVKRREMSKHSYQRSKIFSTEKYYNDFFDIVSRVIE